MQDVVVHHVAEGKGEKKTPLQPADYRTIANIRLLKKKNPPPLIVRSRGAGLAP